MIVVDAGVVVELVAGALDPAVLGDDELCAPHLIDSEVINVLRRLVMRGQLTPQQGDAAVDGFAELVLTRFPAAPLRPRMWALRHNVSSYDATYVALAEALKATHLLTTDARLTTAPGVHCTITLV